MKLQGRTLFAFRHIYILTEALELGPQVNEAPQLRPPGHKARTYLGVRPGGEAARACPGRRRLSGQTAQAQTRRLP